MSWCCVPEAALRRLGRAPFRLRKCEDVYFLNRAALLGPIVRAGIPLAAYRIRPGSLSSNRLLLTESALRAFEVLEQEYGAVCDRRLGTR
jgi:hypothetical protein